MKLVSKAFENGKIIPDKFTCEGDDVSPPLEITEVPANAQSLVIIMDDHDVPREIRADGMWDHWVVFNVSPKVGLIPSSWKEEGKVGRNSWGNIGYGGPCPPDKEHRYLIKVYALDGELELPEGVSKAEVLKTMEGHIIEKVELMGIYNKKDNRG